MGTTVENIEFLPCPFCGTDPRVHVKGSMIDIDCDGCGAGMSMQKSDELTLTGRETWNPDTFRYGTIEEARVLTVIATRWNCRV